MPIAVITATVRELKSALGFSRVGAVAEGEPFSHAVGDHDCLLLATGVGLVNAALRLGELLGRHSVSGVLNLGIAGSFDLEALPLGAGFVATREVWPEYGLETEDGVDARAIRFPQARLAGQEVWDSVELDPDTAARAMGLKLSPDLVRGVSLSVGTVTGSDLSAARLAARRDALAENMEGFALALGCVRAGIPFLEIRAISNLVGSRDGWDLGGALGSLGGIASRLMGNG